MTRWSSAMPIAVMTESSENTMSRIITWPMTLANDAAGLAGPCSRPSSLSWISYVAFASRNRPPPIRIRSRPEIPLPEQLEQRLGQPGDPDDRPQQRDPHHHRGDQADAARALLLLLRQFRRQDRDEDDVVHAEDDFEEGQRDEGDQ